MTRRRLTGVLLVSLVVAGCGGDAGSDVAPAAADRESNTFFEYQGRRYDLAVVGECGTREDGTYGTWAFTLDANGDAVLVGPQLLAQNGASWSVIDFYPGTGDEVVRVYREGRERFGFEGGVLEFDGELGAGNRQTARAKITCPAVTSTQAEQD